MKKHTLGRENLNFEMKVSEIEKAVNFFIYERNIDTYENE